MIEVTQSVELPKEVEALYDKNTSTVHLKVSGKLGLFALNRTAELVAEAAEDLKAAL